MKKNLWIFIILIVTIVCLESLGRIWWAESGTTIPWCFEVASENNSQTLLDPYTFSHILHGVIFFWAFAWAFPKCSAESKYVAALGLEAAWEILENTPFIINRYREITVSLGYYGDSIANSMSDIAACMLGYVVAQKLGLKWSIAVFVLIEVIMLWLIRDCLTLNVIMLVHPFEFLQEWQKG